MLLAFIFSDVGFGEWFVLLAVILVVVGPKRLPETARKFGSWYAKFRRAADSFKRQLMDMDTEFERAVSEAEQQANDALTVEEEVKVKGGGEQRRDNSSSVHLGSSPSPNPTSDPQLQDDASHSES